MENSTFWGTRGPSSCIYSELFRDFAVPGKSPQWCEGSLVYKEVLCVNHSGYAGVKSVVPVPLHRTALW